MPRRHGALDEAQPPARCRRHCRSPESPQSTNLLAGPTASVSSCPAARQCQGRAGVPRPGAPSDLEPRRQPPGHHRRVGLDADDSCSPPSRTPHGPQHPDGPTRRTVYRNRKRNAMVLTNPSLMALPQHRARCRGPSAERRVPLPWPRCALPPMDNSPSGSSPISAWTGSRAWSLGAALMTSDQPTAPSTRYVRRKPQRRRSSWRQKAVPVRHARVFATLRDKLAAGHRFDRPGPPGPRRRAGKLRCRPFAHGTPGRRAATRPRVTGRRCGYQFSGGHGTGCDHPDRRPRADALGQRMRAAHRGHVHGAQPGRSSGPDTWYHSRAPRRRPRRTARRPAHGGRSAVRQGTRRPGRQRRPQTRRTQECHSWARRSRWCALAGTRRGGQPASARPESESGCSHRLRRRQLPPKTSYAAVRS